MENRVFAVVAIGALASAQMAQDKYLASAIAGCTDCQGGGRANPPMPAFRMKPPDAQAVVAYIRSVH